MPTNYEGAPILRLSPDYKKSAIKIMVHFVSASQFSSYTLYSLLTLLEFTAKINKNKF